MFRYLALLLSMTTLSVNQVAEVAQPHGVVNTVAGDGGAGFVSGPAIGPRFMEPVGIAIDLKSGDILVADSAAQRIQKVTRAGIVTTLAGSGAALSSGLGVAGGYLDGSATTARFNHPAALAIQADGGVLVADSFNHCIRRIFRGRVTTVSGNPDHRGATDGLVTEATFDEPRGIAIDPSSGIVYVADFGNGIRSIAGGVVTTLVGGIPKEVESVSVFSSDSNGVLFFSDPRAVYRRHLTDGATEAVVDNSPYTVELGLASIVATGPNDVLATSSLWSSIYRISFGCAGGVKCANVVAGGTDEDMTQAGGFLDGILEQARFFVPVGIALSGSGTVFIADAGNRRIRSFTL